MNLHSFASPVIAAINPWIVGSWQQSDGSTKNADYSRTPTYLAAVDVNVQSQALTYKDLMQLNGVNLGGEARAFYVGGNVVGVLRPDGRGGDLFTLPDGSIWLAVHVLENWNSTAGWTKVAVVRQVPKP